MKFGWLRPQPLTVDQFEEKHNKMLATRQAPLPGREFLPVGFVQNPAAHHWIYNTLIPANPETDLHSMYTYAILQATFELFARHHGLRPFLATRTDSNDVSKHRNLPLELPYDAPDNILVTGLFPSLQALSCIDWAREKTGTPTERLVDNGVRILGALTLMPEAAGVAILDHENRIYGHTPRLHLAGITPFPPEIAP